MCILVTFSISILLIYLLNFTKKLLFDEKSKWYLKACAVLAFASAVAVVYFITTDDFAARTGIYIDYGFAGIMTPVFASLFDFRGIDVPKQAERLDIIPIRVCCLIIPLIALALGTDVTGVQGYALLAIPLLLLYSGERGKYKMKYFFYVFYPAHLVLLTGLYMLTMMIKQGVI